MPLVQQLYEKYRDEGVEIVTVNMGDGPDGTAKFMAGKSYVFIALSDIQGSAGHDYGIQYVLTNFFIDKDGII